MNEKFGNKKVELPSELAKYKEIKGIELGSFDLKKVNKNLDALSLNIDRKYAENPKKLETLKARVDTLREYFTYPLLYRDIFVNDHYKRRAWRTELQKIDPQAYAIYEKQRIRNNERQRFGDLEFLIILLTQDFRELSDLQEEASNLSQGLLTDKQYALLDLKDKIKYVEQFDNNILYFLERINEQLE